MNRSLTLSDAGSTSAALFTCSSVSVSIVIFSTLVMMGCTPKSGTHVRSSAADLETIKVLSVSVQQAENFSVIETRSPTNNTGLLVGSSFGLIGVAVGAGIDAARTPSKPTSENTSLTALPALMQNYDARGELSTNIQRYFRQSNRFERVEEAKKADGSGDRLDALLEINLAEWGIRPCLGTSSGDHLMQAGLHVTAKLIEGRSHRTIWERDDLHLDSECYTVEAFHSQNGLLRARVGYILDDFSARTVNRILYP